MPIPAHRVSVTGTSTIMLGIKRFTGQRNLGNKNYRIDFLLIIIFLCQISVDVMQHRSEAASQKR